MIRDRYVELLHRTVNQVEDGGGGFTESVSDSPFQGYIAELNSVEVLRNKQLGNNATAELFTEEVLSETDRVVEEEIEYEIVGIFTKFHRRYTLKRVK